MKDLQSKNKNTFWKDIFTIVALAFLVVLPIRLLVAQPFVVSGSSMVPTFENGDYIIVDQLTYRIENPERYDVIIFKYPNDTNKYFIKRIIGMPNEIINSENGIISIKKSDGSGWIRIDDSFIKNKKKDTFYSELNENEYFVMGDNRPASSDSRVWGALEKDFIIGKAFVRLLPISKIDFLPGNL